MSTATGIRTRVSAVRGRRPSPLDDSGAGPGPEATRAPVRRSRPLVRYRRPLPADVAELVDAHGSGPCGGNSVEVRVLSSASVGASSASQAVGIAGSRRGRGVLSPASDTRHQLVSRPTPVVDRRSAMGAVSMSTMRRPSRSRSRSSRSRGPHVHGCRTGSEQPPTGRLAGPRSTSAASFARASKGSSLERAAPVAAQTPRPPRQLKRRRCARDSPKAFAGR